MQAGSSSETEIKLRLPGATHGRKLLRAHGFRLVKRRVLETNILFDTAGGRIRRAGTALRIRRAGPRTTFTFKGVAATGRHKSREELEIEIQDAAVFAAILDRLGFEPVFRYEKRRTEYARDGGLAMLDETPIGTYLELEGTPGWIDQIAAELGYAQRDYITTSYAGLYREWRRERPGSPEHMIFQSFKGLPDR